MNERLETVLAVAGCGPEMPRETIDSLKFVAGCVGLGFYEALEYRGFLVPVEENDLGDVIQELSPKRIAALP